MDYVYKVTAEKAIVDGREVNIAKYAYKPYYGYGRDADNLNRRMAWRSGCHNAERYVKGKNFTGLVMLEGQPEFVIETNRGTFTDGWFDRVYATQQELV